MQIHNLQRINDRVLPEVTKAPLTGFGTTSETMPPMYTNHQLLLTLSYFVSNVAFAFAILFVIALSLESKPSTFSVCSREEIVLGQQFEMLT